MMLTETTTYAFDVVQEKESADDFEKNHDMAIWKKRFDTQTVAFTRIEVFMSESKINEDLQKFNSNFNSIDLPKWQANVCD